VELARLSSRFNRRRAGMPEKNRERLRGAKLQALEAQQDKLKVQPAEAPTLPPALHPGIARV
jgi:hypothetical protein